eukprot:TRINITY_DN4573_c0_g1_i2.p1 TRINITY_DN4573_c0_g1~~TRINITY_DN4573_c0_g1_i2.p1  ORF type:complete len:448 (+),score=58.35 TRINITY_DN4573_c0_g1_i2:62-1405(+)
MRCALLVVFLVAKLVRAENIPAERRLAPKSCPACSNTTIATKTLGKVGKEKEKPQDFPCLDTHLPSTLVRWIKERDESENSKFAPYSQQRRVKVNIDIRSLWNINQKSQEYSLKFQIDMSWINCAMVFDGTRATNGTKVLALSGEEGFWYPLLDFNSVHSEEANAVADQSFWILHADGRVLKSMIRIGTFACSFDFTDLPRDTQTCTLKITPVSARKGQLKLDPGSLTLPEAGLTNTQWTISDWTFNHAEATQYINGMEWKFSQLQITFKLTRKPAYYMISVVYPSIIIWALSYAGLFIPIAALPARAALAAIPVLIIINTQTRVTSGLPGISYFTWLDKFLFAVNWMLLAHMAEFALVAFCVSCKARLDKALEDEKKKKDSISVEDENKRKDSISVLPIGLHAESEQGDARPKLHRVVAWIATWFESYFRVAALVAFFLNLIIFLA